MFKISFFKLCFFNFWPEKLISDQDSSRAWIRIRIHHYQIKRIYNWKTNRIYFFSSSKFAFYLSVDLHKGRQSYRRSIQLSKENIQHFKTWNFLTFFYFCDSFLPSCILGHCRPTRIRIRNPVFLSHVVFSWYVVCDQYFFPICRRWNSVWRRGAPPDSGPTGYVPFYHTGLNFRLAHRIYLLGLTLHTRHLTSVPDPHVFGPSGSGSISQEYGSGSGYGFFYNQAEIVRKTLISTICDF